MATTTTNLGLTKPALSESADVGVINDNSDKIDVEAGKSRANLAATYSASSAYAVGDYCERGGNLYRCTTAIGSGGEAWNSGHWTQVAVTGEIPKVIDNLTSTSTTNALSAKQGKIIGDQIENLYSLNGNSTLSFANLVSAISAKSTNDILIASVNPSAASNLINETTSYSATVIIFKSSSSNAYYFATNRDGSGYGNINLSTSTITAKTRIVPEMRSVTHTYSVSAGSNATTNLKTLIDADLPSGCTCIGIAGTASGDKDAVVYAAYYANSNYSLGIRNVGSSALSSKTATIYYLCV